MARPALARTRLEETPARLIRVTFKRPWADGTAGVTFTPLEFVRRLAALVPPPRTHLVHYHGVLAGRSACGGRSCRLRPRRTLRTGHPYRTTQHHALRGICPGCCDRCSR